MTSYLAKIREALLQALAHDMVNTAKAAAYSGMLMFFPALLVITTLVAQVEEGPTLVGETRAVLEQFLPADTPRSRPVLHPHPPPPLRPVDSLRRLSQPLCGPWRHAVAHGGISPRLPAPARELDLLGTPRSRPDAGAHRAGSAVRWLRWPSSSATRSNTG